MKRFLLAAAFVAAFGTALALSSAPASAGLFGGRAKATATPSPTPLPMPTATPEPPNIAIPRLEANLKANPNDRQSMLELAQEFLGINHPEAAYPLTQRLLQLGEKTAQVYYLDSAALQAGGNLPGAIQDMEAAENLDPTNLNVLQTLAALYTRVNRDQDAERVALRAVTFNKTDPQAYTTLGLVYVAEQKWDQARDEFEQAFKLDPKDVTPLMQEAQTWVMQNNIPSAMPIVDRAIAADPKNVQVLIYRAGLYAKMGNAQQAALAFDDAAAAATTDDEKASVMVRKALMYAQLKRPADAEATFNAAIAQYPKVSGLHTAFGEYYLGEKDTTRAQQQFLAALQVDKSDVNALMDMAQLKASQRQMTDAIGYLKQVTQVAPSGQSFAMLGQAYVQIHAYKDARDACLKSFQIEQSPDALGCMAGSDFSMKNYKEAGQIFDSLNKSVKPFMDRDPQLLYMAAVSYTHLNQKDKAVDSYKRLLKILKPGTQEYKKIQNQVADLTKPAAKKDSKKHG